MINRRRKLLPWWMKFFIWIFMVIGGSAIFVNFWEIVGAPINFWFVTESSIYGMETYDRFSILGIFISILIIFKGYTAFAMWTEKEFAIKLGLIDAIVGIIVCIVMMIVNPFFELVEGTWNINLRFEIVFLIPYLIKCKRIRTSWEQFGKPIHDEEPIKEIKREPISKPVSEIEKENKVDDSPKNDDRMDKEDPRRFMPK